MIPLNIATKRWKEDPFYTEAVVLGIDIGIEGIGVAVRRGPEVIFKRTFMVSLPESAALEGRRLMRSARRCRKQRRRRDFLLRMFCEKHLAGAWSPITKRVLEQRLRGLEGKLASPHALIQCLRHIIAHRGYSYHLKSDGAFLWGDSSKFSDAKNWLKAAYCDGEVARLLQQQAEDLEWSDEQTEDFAALCEEAVRNSEGRSIEATLKRHLAKSAGNKKERYRGNAWPREHVQSHLEKICRNHPQFFGGQDRLEKLLPRLLAILNHERKNAQERAAHARGKAGKCDFAPLLLGKADITRGFQGDEAIRVLNLFDFLSTRRVATSDGLLHYPTPAWIYQQVEFAKADSAAVAQNQPRIRTTPTELKKTLLESLNQALGLTGKEALKWEKGSSLNKDYFDQLKDLLCLRRTNFDKRASISSEAAGFITSSLLASPVERVSAINDALSEYRQLRRDRLRSIITSPQVEFLLGGEGRPEGRIQRIFASEEVTKALGKKTKPDFVVIEVVGGAARNTLEAFEIRKAQLEGRKHREELIKKYEIDEADAKGETMLRVSLFEQQRCICPYSGKPLGSPTDSSLEIDHIFPREMGGTSEKRNLVLAFRECNAAKGKRLPYEAAKAGDLPLDWKEILRVCSSMKWGVVNKDGALNKRTIFESLQDSSKCPDWGNLTRQSQIARELRDSAAQWMGIKGDATKMAQCIGTPTGLHTAICRRAWKQSIPRKNRADLTHHLWDAITVSFIPPAKGLNTIEYGGIFHHVTEASAAVTEMTALPVCPDLSSLDKDTDECLVERPRQSSSKKQRFDKSIYGRKADGTLRIRKPIKKGEGIASDEHSLWKALKASGIPDEKIPPPKLLRSWLDSDATGPLRLKDGTPVGSLPIKAGKSGTVMTQVAHRNHEGQSMGVKVAGEANWRLEVWKKQEGTVVKYHTRVIPHPRALKIFKAANGVAAWKKKDKTTGKTWRQQVTGSLPPYAKKVGHFEKGMRILVALMKDGAVAGHGDVPYKSIWFTITSIRSDGRVLMRMAGFKSATGNKGTSWPLQDIPASAFECSVANAHKLAHLLGAA
jgi:hypothetical protein